MILIISLNLCHLIVNLILTTNQLDLFNNQKFYYFFIIIHLIMFQFLTLIFTDSQFDFVNSKLHFQTSIFTRMPPKKTSQHGEFIILN